MKAIAKRNVRAFRQERERERERARSAEYEYTRVPPNRTPQIGPNTLLHFMNNPQCADEQQKWILNQFPKRMTGDLQAEPDKEVLGWRIHFWEGLN